MSADTLRFWVTRPVHPFGDAKSSVSRRWPAWCWPDCSPCPALRAEKLIASGHIPANESVVLCITGHGLKTAEAVAPHLPAPRLINPSLREFDACIAGDAVYAAA